MQKKSYVRCSIFKLKNQNWEVQTLLYSCNMHAKTLHQIDKALSPDILINDDSMVPLLSLLAQRKYKFEMILLKKKIVYVTISLWGLDFHQPQSFILYRGWEMIKGPWGVVGIDSIWDLLTTASCIFLFRCSHWCLIVNISIIRSLLYPPHSVHDRLQRKVHFICDWMKGWLYPFGLAPQVLCSSYIPCHCHIPCVLVQNRDFGLICFLVTECEKQFFIMHECIIKFR